MYLFWIIISVWGAGLGAPGMGSLPQIKDAVPAPPQTAVPAPLPAPIWEALVEML